MATVKSTYLNFDWARQATNRAASEATLSSNVVTLSFITITPDPTTMAVWSTQQFTCIATYSDSSTVDVTADAVWYSALGGMQLSGITPGLATALPTPAGNVHADYTDGITVSADASVTITGAIGPIPSLDIFAMAGNPRYTGSQALTYLEAYPGWNNAWLSYVSGTPNPPGTGHYQFNYTSGTGVFVVTDTGPKPFQGGGWQGSPWALNLYNLGAASVGPQYVTKGYATSFWTGAQVNDGTNWLWANTRALFNNPDGYTCTINTGLTLPASTNYYGQTLIVDSFNATGYYCPGYGGGSGSRHMLHAIGFSVGTPAAWNIGTTYSYGQKVTYLGDKYWSLVDGNVGDQPDNFVNWDLVPAPFGYNMTQVTGVRYVATDNGYTARGSAVPFKVLSANDILLEFDSTGSYIPVDENSQPMTANGANYLIEFTIPAGVFTTNAPFYMWTGV